MVESGPNAGYLACRTLELLVEGRSSHVFLAEDARGRTVALKVPKREHILSEDAAKELVRWASLAELRDRRFFVQILGAELAADGQVHIAMELSSGRTLAAVLQEHGPMSPERASRFLMKIAGAVSILHRRGRPHGSLEPRKIIVEGTGESETVRLLDTEVAYFLGAPASDAVFVAPERSVLGPSMPGDVFALGALLRAMLQGTSASASTTLLPTASEWIAFAETLTQRDPSLRPEGALAVLNAMEQMGPRARSNASGRPAASASSSAPTILSESTAMTEHSGTVHDRITQWAEGDAHAPHNVDFLKSPKTSLGGSRLRLYAVALSAITCAALALAIVDAWRPDSEVKTIETSMEPVRKSVADRIDERSGAETLDEPERVSPTIAAPAATGALDAGTKPLAATAGRDAQSTPHDASAKKPSGRTADAGTAGVDPAAMRFMELDAELGRMLSDAGLSFADLAKSEPVRTRQWGRWYKQQDVPQMDALDEHFEALKKAATHAMGVAEVKTPPTNDTDESLDLP